MSTRASSHAPTNDGTEVFDALVAAFERNGFGDADA